MSSCNIINLEYIKCRSLKHWDEHHSIGGLNGSIVGWSDALPDICRATIGYMMPTFLLNRKLRSGEMLELKVLDTLLHFSVGISTVTVLPDVEGTLSRDPPVIDNDFVVIKELENMKVNITWRTESVTPIDSSSEKRALAGEIAAPTTLWCSFSRKLYRHFYCLYTGIFSSRPWNGVRMVALTGVEGCGKTTSLCMVARKLTMGSLDTGSTPDVIPLLLSASDVGDVLPVSTGQSGSYALATPSQVHILTSFSAQSAARRGVTAQSEGRDPVNALLDALCEWSVSDELQRLHPFRLLLALDDLDSLLAYCGTGMGQDGDGEEDGEDGGVASAAAAAAAGNEAHKDVLTQRAALVLRLMQVLAQPACGVPLLLIGVTLLQTTRQLRSHPLTRGFDAFYPLRRPSLADFSIFYRHFLSTVSSEACLETLSDTGVPALEEWADRLAGLTASRGHFVVGDARELVETILRVHYGALELRKLGSATATATAHPDSVVDADTVMWRTALECCSIFSPRQMRAQYAVAGSALSSRGGSGANSGGEASWADFGGYEPVRVQLQRLLRLFAPSVGPARIAISVPRGVLLHGPPGCGKTFLAGVVAAEAGMSFVSVRSTELLSKWFGDTEASLRRVFAQARASAPCLLFFDEFDAIACKRSAGGGPGDVDAGGWRNRVLSTFLNELDGISSGASSQRVGSDTNSEITLENRFICGDPDIDCGSDEEDQSAASDTLLVLAACQDMTLIDDALLRPGRLQYHIELGRPDLASVRDILRVKLRYVDIEVDKAQAQAQSQAQTQAQAQAQDGGQDGAMDDRVAHAALLDHFAAALLTHNPTPADVDSLCHRAVLLAIKDSSAAGGEVKVVVLRQHLERALHELWG